MLRDIGHTPRPPLRALCFCVLLLLAFACQPTAESPEINLEYNVAPQPPRVGEATIDLKISHKDGQPVGSARVELEGNMTHAGMSPVNVEAKEIEPGSYRGTLNLTMAGDWVVLVNITLADGQRVQRQFDLKAVQPQIFTN